MSANVSTTTSIAANAPIVLQFDRFLDPSTVLRQSFVLTDSSGNAVEDAQTVYDPVLLTVSISVPEGLQVGQPYTLTLPVAPNGPAGGGIRATDNAPLDAPSVIGFQTTAVSTSLPSAPTVEFCNDILPVFTRSCSAASCHGAPAQGADKLHTGSGTSYPAEGLALSTAAWVQTTAIDNMRVANGANSGPFSGTSNTYPGLFGVDMALVSPQHPEESWLLYKCLISPVGPLTTTPTQGTDPCTGGLLPLADLTSTTASDAGAPMSGSTDAGTTDAGDAGAIADAGEADATTTVATATPAQLSTGGASTAEQARLADQVQGNVMPYPSFNLTDGTENVAVTQPLTLDELERLRLWILQGAKIPQDCNVCTE